MRLRRILPSAMKNRLFGNRDAFGMVPNARDGDWIAWKEIAVSDFYQNTQQTGLGNWVCSLPYGVLSKIDFAGKTVLEIGPGNIRHLPFLASKPKQYVICDVDRDCLDMSRKRLNQAEIPNQACLTQGLSRYPLPFREHSFDLLVSFFSLEHLHPFDFHATEISRVLKPGGRLVGGVPCEGGLAWGLGRFLTTRRYVHKNFKINYDKIICWEHPNFADFIIERLDAHLEREDLVFHPFSRLPIDFNLVASFVFKKP